MMNSIETLRVFWRSLVAIPVLAVLLLTLSACGVGQGSATAYRAEDPVRVGMIPVIHFAPLYIAQEKGFFADEGITVEIQTIQNAAAIAPSVLNGQLQFGTASSSPFISAASKGLDVKAIAGAGDVPLVPEDDSVAMLVGEDSPFTTVGDLEGKTVAINAINSQVHISLVELMRQEGADASTVKFVSMPMPEMAAALSADRIDAAAVAEPFITIGLEQGARLLSPLYFPAFDPGGTESIYFSAGPFLEKHPEVAAGFERAITRANKLANEDPALIRRIAVEDLKLPPETADAMIYPTFSEEMNGESVADISEVMASNHFIDSPLTEEQLTW